MSETRPDGSVVAAKKHPTFGRSYGLTLDEAVAALNKTTEGDSR